MTCRRNSNGQILTTIRSSGTANTTAPANTTLRVSVTGVPNLAQDIYSVNVQITTTKTVTVKTIDENKIKR
jgi:hypothetical protein